MQIKGKKDNHQHDLLTKTAAKKYREQGKPLYVAFIDLTKAFDLVSRDGHFKILAKIGCPPTLFSIVKSFHDNMKGTVLYNGATSDPLTSLVA